MKDLGVTLGKEHFERLEMGVEGRVEQAKSKGLRQRGADAIEHRVGTANYHPPSAPLRKEAPSGLDKPTVGVRLGTLEAPGQVEVDKWVQRHLTTSDVVGDRHEGQGDDLQHDHDGARRLHALGQRRHLLQPRFLLRL